jgi:thiamine pyrophosphokinase
VTDEPPPRHALLLADGEIPARSRLDAAWPGWDAGVAIVIAADGGARHAAVLGLIVDRWVGDGDSITPADLDALAAAGAVIERAAPDKDESDAELALLAALDANVDAVVVLGGLGGLRIDHALANLALLEHPRLDRTPITLYDEHAARISLLVGPDHRGLPAVGELGGRIGDVVSLLPIGGSAHHVETEGLRYPLADDALMLGRTRGLSNVRIAPAARVSVGSGRLLVIETPANLRA